jgi:hypothetical protein
MKVRRLQKETVLLDAHVQAVCDEVECLDLQILFESGTALKVFSGISGTISWGLLRKWICRFE